MSYKTYPPLQAPATYNSRAILEQVQKRPTPGGD